MNAPDHLALQQDSRPDGSDEFAPETAHETARESAYATRPADPKAAAKQLNLKQFSDAGGTKFRGCPTQALGPPKTLASWGKALPETNF